MINYIKVLRKKLVRKIYNIGFVEGYTIHSSGFSSKVHWLNLNGYKNGWFADPFIYQVSDKHITVFAEEYVYNKEKGRLSTIIVDRRNMKLLDVKVLLELDTHLSFPIFIKDNGKVYVYPENSERGGLYIYEYDECTNSLIKPQLLISRPLLDAQILKVDNVYYLFAIERTSESNDITRKLLIFKSDSLMGEYKEYQTIENTMKEERGAGLIFEENGMVIRPAQCCEGDYGKATLFYELESKEGKYLEKEIARIRPLENKRWGLGLHTYNHLGDLSVIDGIDYKYRRLNLFLRSILHHKA